MSNKSTAKRYQREKLILILSSLAIDMFFWIIIIFTGLALYLAHFSYQISNHLLLQFYIFITVLGSISIFINFPINFYSGYILEHNYSLSNQNLKQWFGEKFKGLLVGLILGIILMTAFFLLLFYCPTKWWIGVWLFTLIFSILLNRLAPVLIFPIFYKFIPLKNQELNVRINNFASKWKLKITGIYQFNLSKTTKKANAGFTGIGKSKRVILGDTLLENFTLDEIETVFAHEVGHYFHHHLLKSITYNSILSLTGLFLVFKSYSYIINQLNFEPHQLEALPYLGLLFFIYNTITGPLGNYISRIYEYEADRFAVKSTNNITSYKNSLKKLSELNLADKDPHPIVEFLFYSHPSIEHRIQKLTSDI